MSFNPLSIVKGVVDTFNPLKLLQKAGEGLGMLADVLKNPVGAANSLLDAFKAMANPSQGSGDT